MQISNHLKYLLIYLDVTYGLRMDFVSSVTYHYGEFICRASFMRLLRGY